MTGTIRDSLATDANQSVGWLGDSDMAESIRAFDWSTTPLGPLRAWPRSLRSAVAICLHSRFQMAIYWGPALNCIYNDAERDVLGALHPGALGMPARELLHDSWNVVGPQLEAVIDRGEATWAEDQPLCFDRRGMPETGYFTYSYSPIVNDKGGIGGALLVTHETTARVLAERRLEVLRELAEARGRAEGRALADDELRSLLNDLRAAQRRSAEAGDAERQRIERNLHDGAQQRLMAIRLELGLLSECLEMDPTSAEGELDRLRGELDEALEELRELAHGLYPPLLASDGLRTALSAVARHTVIPVEVDGRDLPRLPRAIESAAYFCCLEALQNAAKHAGAGAHATVDLKLGDGTLEFRVRDDGVGFDRDAVEGYGLTNLVDRLQALGGDATISSAPGRGTTVAGQIPLP